MPLTYTERKNLENLAKHTKSADHPGWTEGFSPRVLTMMAERIVAVEDMMVECQARIWQLERMLLTQGVVYLDIRVSSAEVGPKILFEE